MKSAFGITTILDIAKKRISEFEDISIESSKIEKQIEQDWEKHDNVWGWWVIYKRYNTCDGKKRRKRKVKKEQMKYLK